MTTPAPPMCLSCAHLKANTLTCVAYPKGIPVEIIESDHDHRQPFKGDHGIQYQRNQRVKDPFLFPENIFAEEE